MKKTKKFKTHLTGKHLSNNFIPVSAQKRDPSGVGRKKRFSV